MSDKLYLGKRVGSLVKGNTPAPYTRVDLLVDADHYYTAGDDTGRTLEVTCPWGSQEMCNDILASVQGPAIRPYSAGDALIDPAAELGDGITVGGIYSTLATEDILLDSLYSANISTPALPVLAKPYKTLSQRQQEREQARTRSLITKTSEEIRLEVQGVADDLEGLSASINIQLESITQTVQGLDGDVSSLSLTLDGLTYVDDEGTVKISRGSLNLSGSISFGDLDDDVNTAIDNSLTYDQAHTLITDTLVASPVIAGGDFRNLKNTHLIEMGNNEDVDGTFEDVFRLNRIYYRDQEEYNTTIYAINDYHNYGGIGLSAYRRVFLAVYYNAAGINDDIYSSYGDVAYARLHGCWDFSRASPVGLYITYAPDE